MPDAHTPRSAPKGEEHQGVRRGMSSSSRVHQISRNVRTFLARARLQGAHNREVQLEVRTKEHAPGRHAVSAFQANTSHD